MHTQKTPGKLYLIPTVLDESALHTIPSYITDTIKKCSVFMVENAKTARRFAKKLWKEMVIDEYEWLVIDDKDAAISKRMLAALHAGKQVAIISEAGCPGVADPGQSLVLIAQQQGYRVIPLVGPNSILLALMASGMNGQHFTFHGYLPIDSVARKKKIKELETISLKENSTQLFIETPYRNQAMLADLINTCRDQTLLCVAADITGDAESILSQPIGAWKKGTYQYHKRPAIFLLLAQ
jgi:16S rRNA (cytidine1402-2'-O)-methyltransferase